MPIRVVGNPDLQEERLDAYEVGYTGIFGRSTVTAAAYINKIKDQILFTQVGTYGISPPPPGFPAQLGPFPGAVIWGGIFQSGIRFPSDYTYRNFGKMTQKGFESGRYGGPDRIMYTRSNPGRATERPIPAPSAERLNIRRTSLQCGGHYNVSRFLGSLGISYVDEAFWQDVLDARYHGRTDAYTLVNGSVGIRFGSRNRAQVMLKGTNLLNEDIQQHIFGDIIKRQLAAELRINF